jgi:hypothetical protein
VKYMFHPFSYASTLNEKPIILSSLKLFADPVRDLFEAFSVVVHVR